MRFIVYLTVIVLVSCGNSKKESDPRQFTYIQDEEIRDLVSYFEFLYGTSIQDIGIGKVRDLKDSQGRTVLGLCVKHWGGEKREILLHSQQWYALSKQQKLILIFHELGHCELDRSHIEEYIPNYRKGICPVSIMHPRGFNLKQIDYCYYPKIKYYYDELFGRE